MGSFEAVKKAETELETALETELMEVWQESRQSIEAQGNSSKKRLFYHLSTVGIESMCQSLHARACEAREDQSWAWSQAEAQGNFSRYDGLAITWLPGMRFDTVV